MEDKIFWKTRYITSHNLVIFPQDILSVYCNQRELPNDTFIIITLSSTFTFEGKHLEIMVNESEIRQDFPVYNLKECKNIVMENDVLMVSSSKCMHGEYIALRNGMLRSINNSTFEISISELNESDIEVIGIVNFSGNNWICIDGKEYPINME